MSKCKIDVNDLVNDLWDGIQSNNKDEMDNSKLSTKAKTAGQIIRAKAEQRKSKLATGKPQEIPFFNTD